MGFVGFGFIFFLRLVLRTTLKARERPSCVAGRFIFCAHAHQPDSTQLNFLVRVFKHSQTDGRTGGRTDGQYWLPTHTPSNYFFILGCRKTPFSSSISDTKTVFSPFLFLFPIPPAGTGFEPCNCSQNTQKKET
jgi:hypothetical protein